MSGKFFKHFFNKENNEEEKKIEEKIKLIQDNFKFLLTGLIQDVIRYLFGRWDLHVFDQIWPFIWEHRMLPHK